MKITFWGVRGSIPCPGKETVRYGGNTTCIEVNLSRGLIIFDTGTGARLLGKKLIRDCSCVDKHDVCSHIFYTHSHWDHIQGFPFFAPCFLPGYKVNLYGEEKEKEGLRISLQNQQEYPNFPVKFTDMPAELNFHSINEHDVIRVEESTISNLRLCHPNGSFAYRIDEGHKSFVFATDSELYPPMVDRVSDFVKNVDILVHDSQYTPGEYNGDKDFPRKGWGHSTYEDSVNMAIRAGVKTLVLFHHDPDHNDDFLDDMLIKARNLACGRINVLSAFEGMELEIL